MTSYTNSSLTVARRCLREYDLRYNLRLTPGDESSEALDVGTTWHAAHDAHVGRPRVLPVGESHVKDAMEVINHHAPTPLWAVKLSRLFMAYDWYWASQPLNVVEAESRFKVALGDIDLEGKIDGRVELPDGRRGIMERKTTSEDIGTGAPYWDRLRLDTQVGIYGLAAGDPDFILYDVVRKPTIKPKQITKAEVIRMSDEQKRQGFALYFSERFEGDELEHALEVKHESNGMYGARLTADIGDRPAFYFARREVHRTRADYGTLEADIWGQHGIIKTIRSSGVVNHGAPRNPDACQRYGRTCPFFRLCSNNEYPQPGEVPSGFHVREHLHPELAD